MSSDSSSSESEEDGIIWEKPSYDDMNTLLNQIYIARNITLDQEKIYECLRQIDKWYRVNDPH